MISSGLNTPTAIAFDSAELLQTIFEILLLNKIAKRIQKRN